jgi:hypothetical protein
LVLLYSFTKPMTIISTDKVGIIYTSIWTVIRGELTVRHMFMAEDVESSGVLDFSRRHLTVDYCSLESTTCCLYKQIICEIANLVPYSQEI